jgi:hypothetical protein
VPEGFCVYLHCRPDGTPFYVGKGKPRRAVEFYARSNYHKRIVAKYGRENIQVMIFPRDSEEEAFQDEMKWIGVLREYGFRLANFCDGGEGASGQRHSSESRARMRIAKKNISEETRARMRAAQKGRINSPEAIIKMKLNHRHARPWLGKALPPAMRAHLSAINTGKKLSIETRQKQSIAAKRAWAKPSVRAKIIAAIVAHHHSENAHA